MESPKPSNKISDIVKLKRMLKKWRIQASHANTTTVNNNSDNKNNDSRSSSSSVKKGSLSRSNSKKGMSFLKRTLSFTDLSTNGSVSSNAVPKGFLAVHVGEEMKRFIIPTNYLAHQEFCVLLKDAEDEFGFQQEGILKIPCEVPLFENILRMVDSKNSPHAKKILKTSRNDGIVCGSIESRSVSKSYLPPSPMCR